MRHLPDFTAVRRGRSWVGHSKINDEHFGAAEAYVDRLVEAIGHKDVFFRVLGVRDEVAHQPPSQLQQSQGQRQHRAVPQDAQGRAGLLREWTSPTAFFAALDRSLAYYNNSYLHSAVGYR
jgi:hypothetical protein